MSLPHTPCPPVIVYFYFDIIKSFPLCRRRSPFVVLMATVSTAGSSQALSVSHSHRGWDGDETKRRQNYSFAKELGSLTDKNDWHLIAEHNNVFLNSSNPSWIGRRSSFPLLSPGLQQQLFNLQNKLESRFISWVSHSFSLVCSITDWIFCSPKDSSKASI